MVFGSWAFGDLSVFVPITPQVHWTVGLLSHMWLVLSSGESVPYFLFVIPVPSPQSLIFNIVSYCLVLSWHESYFLFNWIFGNFTHAPQSHSCRSSPVSALHSCSSTHTHTKKTKLMKNKNEMKNKQKEKETENVKKTLCSSIFRASPWLLYSSFCHWEFYLQMFID